MAKLPAGCIPDLTELARISGRAGDTKSLRSSTLKLINKIFCSDSSIMWLTDEDNRIIEPVDLNIQSQFFPQYSDYFFRLNPFDPVNMPFFTGTAVAMEQVVPFNEFKKSEYYNDFVKPQKIRRQMVVYIRVDDRLSSIICTHRTNEKRYEIEDLTAGHIVASHLSNAFDRIRLLQKVKTNENFFKMILNTNDVGILVFDSKKNVLFSNQKLIDISEKIQNDIILKKEKLNKMDTALPPIVFNDCERIRKLFENNRKNGIDMLPKSERVLSISPFEKCRFKCKCLGERITSFNRPLFLVTMEILPVISGANHKICSNEYKLTKREIEIVTHIIKGCKNIDIANRLFISEGTVKNHLRNIFEKVGVKNRTSLINQLLHL